MENTTLARYVAKVREYNHRELASLADVGDADVYRWTKADDGTDKRVLTEGADMLDTVWCDFVEAREQAEDWQSVDRAALEDSVHEWADSAVPIYNADRVQALMDLQAWAEDVSEFGEPSDIITAIGWALYEVARRLGYALVQEFADADEADYTDEAANS